MRTIILSAYVMACILASCNNEDVTNALGQQELLNESLNLRLGVGPYFETGRDWGLGVSGEAGLEWKRYFAGVAYFQDCVKSSYKDEGFHFSFGYRF